MKNYIPQLLSETVTYEYITKLKRNPPGLGPLPYDAAAFSRTDIGRRRDELLVPFEVYRDAPMHPDLLRYWADRGLKKELFDDEGRCGFDAPHEYSVFTPLGLDPSKKYALIYFSHGGGQPIEWAEHYGFNTLAARERYIVVYAQNGGRSNDESETEFARITGRLRDAGYPVDWERVYAAGFSSGSEASARIAAAFPKQIAAVACMPDGVPFRTLAFDAADETVTAMKQYRMPGIFIGGGVDICDFPAAWALNYTGSGLGVGTVENAVNSLRAWIGEIAKAQSAKLPTYPEVIDLLAHAEDPVEREFGLHFDRSWSFHVQGADWLGGEFYGADGAPVMRWARAQGVPHMVWESQANLVWDYLKHFRRDLETGESIYDPITCWGER